ncbi:TetR/AcrR family transcriptional regulator [Pseudonocardia xishanensis]|uniref:TetR/AcrR family transcriptional regulator n=1 Tax=Pseudonocardia xishanensis TaxID=630995 RepID=A0ABP8RUE8_9PSEU
MTLRSHTPPTPQQARSELSTSRLLDAAMELIGEVGFERATLAAIGERAGYSPGLVTRRFGSKEGLLWTMIERMVVDWNSSVLGPAVGDSGGRPALHTMVTGIHASAVEAPARMRALYLLMFEALLPIPLLRERMAELHRGMRESVAACIARGVDDGTVDPAVDVPRAARLFVGALRGAAYQALLDGEVGVAAAIDDVHALIDPLLPSPS